MYLFEINDNGYISYLKIKASKTAEAIEKYKNLFGDLKNVTNIYVQLIYDDINMEA